MTFVDNLNSFIASNCFVSFEEEPCIRQLLKAHSKLSEEKISEVIRVIPFLKQESQGLRDRHLCRCESGLPVGIHIKGPNEIFIPLKNFQIGKGHFRVAYGSIVISDSYAGLMVDSSQLVARKSQELIANQEVQILEKISKVAKAQPGVEGIYRYYASMTYDKQFKGISGLKAQERFPGSYVGELQAQGDADEYRIDSGIGNLRTTGESLGSASESLSSSTMKMLNSDDYEVSISEGRHADQQSDSEELVVKKKHVMIAEYYNGGNLDKRLMSQLPDEERYLIAKQLLNGLAFLHEMNIFHSDLKSDNILLAVDENQTIIRADIADFGFACDLNDPNDRVYKNGSEQTLPPEWQETIFQSRIRKGQAIDETILTIDIYSMGMILNSLFEKSNAAQTKDLIKDMISREPTQRPTAQAALDSFLKQIPSPMQE